MANISYITAAAQCLPGIGPLVGLVKGCIGDRSIERARIIDSAEKLEQIESEANARFRENPTNIVQMARNLNTEATTSIKDITHIIKKGRVHSICGIVGDLLTIVSLVALIALGMFNIVLPAIFIGILAIDALLEVRNLHNYNQAAYVMEKVQRECARLERFVESSA
ncbi:MAG: hypothetical protein RL235_251 [Chlamydiota bacterium]|jgi:hypothetical protein